MNNNKQVLVMNGNNMIKIDGNEEIMLEYIMNKKCMVTSSIFYCNSSPHIGSTTEVILASLISNILRKFGLETRLLTGTDEHGNKIKKAADDNNMSPLEFVNEKSYLFKNLFDRIINYDRFIRTTDEDHIKKVLEIWNKLEEDGFIYKGHYEGFYCRRQECFYTKDELKDGKCPITGDEVEYIKEDCFYFKLSAFKDQLIEWVDKMFVEPEGKKNELKGFLKQELKDLCITRAKTWGIDIHGMTIYVWFDALINYITGAEGQVFNETIHVIGMDILTFHGIYWAAMQMALNITPNYKIIVHNWWFDKDGKKMSKSLGNVVDPNYLLDKYGKDYFVFYFGKENLIGGDKYFDEEKFVETCNQYLVNKFSNLIYRVQCLAYKKNHKFKSKKIECFSLINLREAASKLDINEYNRILFDWCDNLNAMIDEKKIWNNIEELDNIYPELERLVYYFDALVPGVHDKFKEYIDKEPKILYSRI
jgi:methionyl-tRNA synthetase